MSGLKPKQARKPDQAARPIEETMTRGRINNEDIAALRARVPVEDIIAERVTLRRSGSGLTGLCPFHDEGSPSFSVSPAKGMYHCFGCNESGDVITFIQKMESLTFVEAVERLADKVGFQLRYEAADPNYKPAPPGQRQRLLEAHRVAQAFYRHALRHDTSATAKLGLKYLIDRGFSDDDMDTFGVGYAPEGFDALLSHLKDKGFTADEILLSGLATKNDNGKVYDRFRGRLTWPIKEISGDIIGFGARRLSEDDKGPKWLNTPDTPLYKKSDVLYGIDTARKHIAADRKVVVVEGYGDVMAAHLSGVPHAVATCGTAFGDNHIRIIRRLLRDDQAYAGKVIFTFDGDEAGQKAALRAFKDHHKFASQTFVAIAPDNMDPLDLRLAKGDQAVRDLIDSAVPLVEFALKNIMTAFDLTLSEGRTNALRAMGPVLADIKDVTLRSEYIRRVSGWLALPEPAVRSAVNSIARNAAGEDPVTVPESEPVSPTGRPNPHDPALRFEREILKAFLQGPAHLMIDLLPEVFTNTAYREIFLIIQKADGDALEHARTTTAGGPLESMIAELAVEPVQAQESDLERYVEEISNRLWDRDAESKITNLKVQLANAPTEDQPEIFTKILALEKFRKSLR